MSSMHVPDMNQELETLHANFKLASNVGYSAGHAGVMGPNASRAGRHQGAVFLGIVSSKPPSEFGDKGFAGIDVCLLWPLAEGIATAPYQYQRGSKLDQKTLQAVNKTGLPLTMWADADESTMRFHTWTKSNFNRGPRDANSWEFGGKGDVLTMFVEAKDMEEAVYENGKSGSIPFYLDGRAPTDPIQEFDLVRIALMPKSKDALSKPKKTCFAFKGVGPCTRSLASYLPRLRAILPKTLSEATTRAESTIRESKTAWAHQLSMKAPSSSDGDFSTCEARTVSFLETNIGGQSTFMYESLKSEQCDESGVSSGQKNGSSVSSVPQVVRMCIKSANGFDTYHLDMPVHLVLQCTNANNLDDAIGMLTLAASAGALNAVVMHNAYWGTQDSCVSALGGTTPFRGVPIIDSSKLLAPIINENFLASVSENMDCVVDASNNRKAKIKDFDMGFKVFINTLESDGTEAEGGEMTAVKVLADISLHTRCIQAKKHANNNTNNNANNNGNKAGGASSKLPKKAYDQRLAPHGCMDMDSAHVICFHYMVGDVDRVIMNLNFNAVPEVGIAGGAGSVAGKKHTWQHAIPSAIDEDSDDDSGEGNGGGGLKKRRLVDGCSMDERSGDAEVAVVDECSGRSDSD